MRERAPLRLLVVPLVPFGRTTICRVFLVLGYYTYTIMVVIGSTRFREQSKGSLLVLRCVVTRQKYYSRDHGIYICLRTGCVSFLLSV